jgi:tetratricopeptide (TPR) repeat protein
MSKHQMKIINDTNMWETRSCRYDPDLNKSLNGELKRLYTAITRAKSNLWIYDSNESLRLPMFNYWYKRNLVKIVETHGNDAYGVVFAANSAPEQWKAQGDNLMEKHHFEQALHCYRRAGKENKHLVKKADAYCLLQYALNFQGHSKGNPKLWLELVIKFLETTEYYIRSNSLDCMTSVELLNNAAMCLRTSQLPRFSQIARLFEHIGKVEEASQMYLKAEDVERYARMKEKLGQHNEVIQTLWNEPFFKRRDALAKAKSYEESNVQLLPKWTVSALLYSCVKFYCERQDIQTLIEVVEYMPQVSKRVKFLKDAKLYTEAYDVLVQHKYFKEACTLASAQGGCTDVTLIASSMTWLSKGLEIATQISDEALRASFIFQMAGLDLTFRKKASKDFIKELESLQSSKSYHMKAQAYLFFGMFKKSASNLNSAKALYHGIKHSIGELEAFNQLQQFDNKYLTDQLLLNVCHLSVETSQALKDAKVFCKELKDAISFYGMDWTGSCYVMPPGQNIWIKDLLMNCVCTDKQMDLDGMVRLDFSKVKRELVRHCKMFKLTWLARHKLQRRLEEKLTSFTLHEQLRKYNHFNCTCPDSKACTEKLQEYLHTSVQMLELQCLNNHSDSQSNIEQHIAMLVAVFTPRVSIFVQKPHQFNAEHISAIRQSVNSQKWFQQYISESILDSSVQHDDIFHLKPWITAWRACCISDPDMKGLSDILHNLEKLENGMNSHTTNIKSQLSPRFIFWHNDEQYYHIFSIWLTSCTEIREKENPLWAARLAIKHFLGHVDLQQNIASTLDIVYLLSVHCTSLLAILTHVNALYGYTTNNYAVPLFYKKIVGLFDLMNTWKPEHHCLLPACGSSVRKQRNHLKVVDDCYHLLAESLQILLGTEGYLELNLKSSPSDIGTHHCLILALVLLGNINIYPVPSHIFTRIKNFTENLKSLIRGCLDNKTEMSVPMFILEAESAIRTFDISKASNIFKLVTKLLVDAKVDSTLAVVVIDPQSDSIKIEPVSSTSNHSDAPLLRQTEFTNYQHGTQKQSKQKGSSSLPRRVPSQMPQLLHPSQMHHGPILNIPSPRPAHLTFAQRSADIQCPVPIRLNSNMPLQPPGHGIVPPRPPMWPQMSPQGASFNPMQSYYSSGYSQYPILESHQHSQIPPSSIEYTESDDIEEEEIKLTADSSSEPSIDPAVIDPERIIVTDKYCNACGVSLINTELPVVSSAPTESQSQDFHMHVMSSAHRESFGQFTIFSSRKDDKDYKQVLQDLNNLKDRCQEAKQAYESDTHQLDQAIDGIQEKIDEGVETISSHEKARSWREGSNAISRLKESLSRLLRDYEELYAKVSDELKTRHQDMQIKINKDVLLEDLEELERRTEKHDSMLDELDTLRQLFSGTY